MSDYNPFWASLAGHRLTANAGNLYIDTAQRACPVVEWVADTGGGWIKVKDIKTGLEYDVPFEYLEAYGGTTE